MKINLEIYTPEKLVLKEEVDEITIPTKSGYITILPNHVPLMSIIDSGEMVIVRNGKKESYAITGGFLEVSESKVNILGEYAVRAEDIELAKAEEAKKRAENKMKEKVSEQDFAEVEAQLRRSLLELKVGRKTRTLRS